MAELLEHVLQVRGHGASGHEEALCDLRVGQSFGHEVDHANLGGGEALPSERRATRRAGPSHTERAQRGLDPDEVPAGLEALVGDGRLAQQGDRVVRPGDPPEGNAGVFAGRGQQVGPGPLAVHLHCGDQRTHVLVEEATTAESEAPGGWCAGPWGAPLQLLGDGSSTRAISSGLGHAHQVRAYGPRRGLQVANWGDLIPRLAQPGQGPYGPALSLEQQRTDPAHPLVADLDRTGHEPAAGLIDGCLGCAQLASVESDVRAEGVGEHVPDLELGVADEAEPGLCFGERVVPLAAAQPQLGDRPVVQRQA